MSLLITRIFGDEVEVFAADDQRSVHFGGDDGSGKNTSTDGDSVRERELVRLGRAESGHMSVQSSEGAFLVYVKTD